MEFVVAGLLFALLLLSTITGWAVRRALDERHLTAAAIESMRLLMGMLLTFSALVLGLLVTSAKARFDGFDKDLGSYSADLIQLDQGLRNYGAEAAPIRAELRSYTAAAIADSWPDEPAPSGSYPHPNSFTSVESRDLGRMLADVQREIGHLEPPDPYRKELLARVRSRVASAVQQRWSLILATRAEVSWPFLVVLASWLAIVYALFGLTAPPSRLV